MLSWYRKLIALRRSTPDLNDAEPGNTETKCDPAARWLSVQRGDIAILVNLGTVVHSFPVAAGAEVLLCSRDGVGMAGDAMAVPPDTVAIVRG